MIRFIDLTNQITADTKEFAFFDTVVDKFKEFSDCQTWETIEDFKLDYEGDELERYLALIPDAWPSKEKENPWKNVNVFIGGKEIEGIKSVNIEQAYIGIGEHEIMNEFRRKVSAELEEKLKTYFKENLSQLGYVFSDDTEFIDLFKNRVNRLSFEDKPNYYEFYLDFVDIGNKGKFIGCYSDKVEFVNEGSKITAIIGKSIG